jgi:Integrase core domain
VRHRLGYPCRPLRSWRAVCPGAAVPTILVGRMSAILPIRQESGTQPRTESAHLQASSGAPGWNRTSDTRFRNHAESVMGCSGPCAKVLHRPWFCAGSVLGRGEASCRQDVGSASEETRKRHSAPETNGFVERLDQTRKYEHLYQREIEQAAVLAEEVEAFLALYNEVRPHESLGQRIPFAMHRGDQHLFRALSLQDP